MDTVPPFIPSSEDASAIYGRGSCDAKGIIAAQIAAAERLRQQGIYVGLLFVAGEERDSLGAKDGQRIRCNSTRASLQIFGQRRAHREPHCARLERHAARRSHGFRPHGAFRLSGARRIGDRQADCLRSLVLRAMPLPTDPEIGPCTLNIGLIEGGRAPNVIPDYAHADLLYRLIGPRKDLRSQILATAGDQVKVDFRWNFPSCVFAPSMACPR
jgi:acetylornithine deacetylase